MTHFYVTFALLYLSLLPFKYLYVFVYNPKNYFMIFPTNSSGINPITFFNFLSGNDLSSS